MMKNPLSNTRFIKSAFQTDDFVTDCGMEIAVIGRSNAGKSSAINKICNNQKLAKMSKTPGRTQAINFFEIKPDKRLVDLPGYGYANISHAMRKKWDALLGHYFATRKSLCYVLLIVDIRRGLSEADTEVIDWITSLNPQLLIHILLTKSDKLSSNQITHALNEAKDLLRQKEYVGINMQTFSSHKAVGVDEARRKLSKWLLLQT